MPSHELPTRPTIALPVLAIALSLLGGVGDALRAKDSTGEPPHPFARPEEVRAVLRCPEGDQVVMGGPTSALAQALGRCGLHGHLAGWIEADGWSEIVATSKTVRSRPMGAMARRALGGVVDADELQVDDLLAVRGVGARLAPRIRRYLDGVAADPAGDPCALEGARGVGPSLATRVRHLYGLPTRCPTRAVTGAGGPR